MAGQGGSDLALGGSSDGGLLGEGGTTSMAKGGAGHGGAAKGGAAQGGAAHGGAAHGGAGHGGASDAGSPNAGAMEQGGEGGSGGEPQTGLGGASSGGSLGKGGGSSSGGTTALGGATCVDSGGAANVTLPSSIPCIDGCALLYLPFAATCPTSPFFTINLDIANGVNLSTAVITAKVRALDFTGTNESIRFYASALPNYAFYAASAVSISSLVNGGTLTMDLTNTPGWDHTKVMSFGFNIGGSDTSPTIWLLVEEITITGSSTAGPWLFRNAADVNESSNVGANFATPNIIFANNYNHLPGQKAKWIPGSGSGGVGGSGGAGSGGSGGSGG